MKVDGKSSGMFQAASLVIDRLAGRLEGAEDEKHAPGSPPQSTCTVISAVTELTPPEAAEISYEIPQDVPPRFDPFNRCLRLISDPCRTYRVAFKVPYSIPSYEKLPAIILYSVGQQGSPDEFGEGTFAWGPNGALMLDHKNISDIAIDPWLEPESVERIRFFRRFLQDGNPFFLWLEWIQEARRALTVDGDYALAVVLANTASEVFLDALLSLLLWDSGADPESAAGYFEEGKVTRRLKSNFPSLLGGNWSLDAPGPIASWFKQSFQLRHRVVHGGYRPTRAEAAKAVQLVYSLENYCYTRLADKRGIYPRATLMTLAKDGLQRRGLWKGAIKKFSEDASENGEHWGESFYHWRENLNTARESQT
ncbi:hypothetical protein ACFV4M_19140 [Kitasatospora indigofera]|uniref:hypothetical protein n=1 Tax=Kitasatospora indigofera TaxID=67307 RepID=UPI0036629703